MRGVRLNPNSFWTSNKNIRLKESLAYFHASYVINLTLDFLCEINLSFAVAIIEDLPDPQLPNSPILNT